jgi:hypothetical protein
LKYVEEDGLKNWMISGGLLQKETSAAAGGHTYSEDLSLSLEKGVNDNAS